VEGCSPARFCSWLEDRGMGLEIGGSRACCCGGPLVAGSGGSPVSSLALLASWGCQDLTWTRLRAWSGSWLSGACCCSCCWGCWKLAGNTPMPGQTVLSVSWLLIADAHQAHRDDQLLMPVSACDCLEHAMAFDISIPREDKNRNLVNLLRLSLILSFNL